MQRILTLFSCLLFFYSGFCTDKGLYDFNLSKDKLLNGPGPDTISYTGSLCFNGNLTLTANNAPNGATFQWQLDNTDISGATSSSYNATSIGTYKVIVNSNAYPSLKIGLNPVPSFTFTNDNQCSGTNIQFSQSVSNGVAPFTYAWTFGNGGTSSSANPNHIYALVGCGTASLTNTLIVTDANGCTGSVSNLISVKQLPDVQLQDENIFSPFSNCPNSPTIANPNFTIKVDNISQSAACITAYSVNWGDGNSQTGLTTASFPLTHTYTELGAFNLTVTGLGNNGCSNSKKYLVANQSNPAGGLGTLGSTTGLCAPAEVPFIISNWQNNSPGTTYYLDFGDGTSITLTHPLNPGLTPDTVKHTYTTSSCPNNSYTATLVAINACDSTPYTAGNIQIRIKPIASFTVPTKICVGQNICFNNTTTLGSYGPNCLTTTAYSWDFGDGSPVSNLQAPCHIYTTAGTYIVTLTTSNPCGPSTFTQQVCVANPLTPSFTLDNITGCSPVNVKATNTTNTINSCGTVSYLWKVTYTASNCGTTSSFSYTNNTSDTSTNPFFVFNNAGTYAIQLSSTNPCGTFISTIQTVTVKKKPQLSIATIAGACGPIIITPAATVTNCGTGTLNYVWSFGGGVPSGFSGAIPGNISFATPGQHIVDLSVTNECGTTDTTQTFSIDNVTTSNAGPTQNICGTTATMAANNPGTAGGTWTVVTKPLSAIPKITLPNSPTTTITNLTATGMYVFQWTIGNSSCSSSSNDTVNISSGPTTATAGPDQDLCLATTATLAGDSALVGTGTWTFVNGPSGYAITNPSYKNTTVTGLMPGVYTFRWTISFSNCPPSSDDVQITVNDSPTPSVAGALQHICGVTTATMAANTPSNGEGNWRFISGPGTPTIQTPLSPATLISSLVAGTYVFQWTISKGSCTSSSNDTVIVAQSPTIAVAGADQNSCLATMVTLAANKAVIGTGQWTFISGPSGYTITDPSLNTTTVTSLVPGKYIFRWTISSTADCTPSSDDVQITIDSLPTTSLSAPLQNICGNTATMAGNKAIYGTGKWTVVSGPNSPSISDSSLETTSIGNLIPGTYILKWTISSGTCTSASNDTIIISSGATVAKAGNDQDLCLATITKLDGNDPGTSKGLWKYINGPIGSAFADSSVYNTTVTGLTPGVYTYRWTTSFSNCPLSADDVLITIYDNPTKANAGADDTICTSTVNLSANKPIIGKGLWSLISNNTGYTIVDPTLETTQVTGLIPGTYLFQWQISNGACTASLDTVQIVVAATATVPDAGADQILCADSVTTLTANTATVGNGAWSFASSSLGSIITTPASPSTTITGLKSGIYNFSWSITNSVCPTLHDTVQIVVLDSLQNKIANTVDTICSGQMGVINGVQPTGGTGSYIFQWQQSADGNNWTDIPSATTNDYNAILISSIYFRRKVSSLPCASYSNIIYIVVQPAVANNIITANQDICINTAGAIITGSIPTGGDGKYSYQWQQSIDGGQTWNAISGANNKDIDPGILIQTTAYRRNVNTSLCNGPQANISDTVTITVHPDSKALFTASQQINCAPFVLDTFIHVTSFAAGNGLYQWYANGTSIGSNSIGSFPGYTIATAGDSVSVKLVTTSQYGCKPDSMQLSFITIKTAFAHFAKDTSFGCEPLPVNFTNTTNIISGTQFFWDFGNGQTFNDVQPSIVTYSSSPFNTDTTYRVTLKAYNGCDTTVWIESIKVRANPKARFGIDTTAGCSPFTVHINNTSLGAPNTYYWDFGNGHLDTTYTIGTLNYTYNIGNAVDTFTIRLVAENECKTDTSSINVRVAPNTIHAQISINASDLYGCAPDIVSFNNSTAGATKLTWDFGDGTTPLVTDNNQNPVTHTYTDSGVYTIRILATNNCSDTTVYKQVTVYRKPVAVFTTNAASYCVGDTVRTKNNSQNATNYNWFFGDGTASTNIEPTHVYPAAGNYTIYLRAERTNSFGLVCYDTLVQSITVLSKPIVTIQSNINSINCAPFTLTAAAPGITNETATWYIYDSSLSPQIITANGNNTQYTYLKPGVYYIQLVAQNALGCVDSSKISFTIYGTPVASFTPDNLAICKTDTTIIYTNTTTYNGIDNVGYKWFVNNNLSSTNANFTYHYTAPQNALLPYTFNTMLIAANTVGCSDTVTAVLKMNPSPKAQFNSTNPNACVPFVLAINNTSLYADTYKWLLNGVGVSTDAIPTIGITKASTNYTVTLIVNNSYGCKADTVANSFVSRIKPIASFKVNDTLGCTGKLNIVTTNTSNHASSYIWDWGDATATSTFTSPTHLYASLGQYLITLVASDGVCTDTANQLVKVSQKPVVNFSADRFVGCGNTAVQFTNLSSNAVSYLWIFGDGNISIDVDPTNVYAPAATLYSVKLIATSDFGCKDSAIKANYIRAILTPASGFDVLPGTTISIPDYTFSFNNLTINSANYRYLWSLGDNTFTDTRDIAAHQYADTGNYIVQLIVLDTITNCTDTTIRIVRIDGYPGYLYVPNAFYPNSQRSEFRTFKPVGKGLADYELQIFDSWGKLLFETKNLNVDGSPADAWDGTFNGKAMQQDAYAWRIIAHFRNGQAWDGMQYGSSRKVTFGTINLFR